MVDFSIAILNGILDIHAPEGYRRVFRAPICIDGIEPRGVIVGLDLISVSGSLYLNWRFHCNSIEDFLLLKSAPKFETLEEAYSHAIKAIPKIAMSFLKGSTHSNIETILSIIGSEHIERVCPVCGSRGYVTESRWVQVAPGPPSPQNVVLMLETRTCPICGGEGILSGPLVLEVEFDKYRKIQYVRATLSTLKTYEDFPIEPFPFLFKMQLS